MCVCVFFGWGFEFFAFPKGSILTSLQNRWFCHRGFVCVCVCVCVCARACVCACVCVPYIFISLLMLAPFGER